MKKAFLITAILTTIIFISWNTTNNNEAYVAISPGNFDNSVRPGDDFYTYVNGNWLKKNPIPSTETRWTSFSEIKERNINNLKVILEEASAANAPAGSIKQKIGDFYYTATDSVTIEKTGLQPLKPEFDKIAAIKILTDLPAVISHLHYIDVNVLFSLGIAPDSKNSERNIVHAYQGGLSLPDRDYYLKEDPKSSTIRNAYQKHLYNMFKLMGDNQTQATANAQKILMIETELARQSRTRVKMRDSEANYNKKSYEEFKSLTPDFNWDNYMKTMGVADVKEIIVGQPEFYTAINTLLKKFTIDDWKNYLRWHLINEMSPRLNSAFDKEHFNFFGKTLTGIKEMRPRWKRALEATDQSLGEALGQLYVEKHFTAESKAKVNEMIDNLISAYRERISSRPWMSDETKKKALEKLNAISRKIGYPDKWMDYSKLEINRDSYVMNHLRSRRFLSDYVISQLNKPVDKTRWGMTPPTVNAYYSSIINEIVFPAGIMQPPFFNAGADDAVNYGAMGAIIGHELTHGFDDQGSRFDAKGNMQEWWTEADKDNFKKKTAQLVSQFNSYKVLDSIPVNGELTLGENIADLGGLTLAYYAFKKSLEGKSAPAKIDGFTAEQRFFISWAQAWRGELQPEARRNQIMTDPHSPGQFRANGPVSNMVEFYEAFGVKQGDKLYKPVSERISIW